MCDIEQQLDCDRIIILRVVLNGRDRELEWDRGGRVQVRCWLVWWTAGRFVRADRRPARFVLSVRGLALRPGMLSMRVVLY